MLRPGALGDTLLAVPALRALRGAYAPVTLAAHPGAVRLLASVGEVARGMPFDDPSLAWVFNRDAVQQEDVLVAWMAPAPGLRHAKIVAPSRPPAMDRHCARYLLETLAPLGIDLAWDEAPLRVTPLVTEEVLVHPGSGSPAKNWPPDCFAKLVRNLDAPVRLVVGEADRAAADAVQTHLGQALPWLEQLTFEELASRLAGCRAYVGNDSGVSHLAGLCGARTVAIFGPSDPSVWRPLGPNVHIRRFDSEPGEIASLLNA